jgi:hypothetical protein
MTRVIAKPTFVSIHTYLKKLKSLVRLLSLFKDEETAEKLDQCCEQVNAMLVAAKKDPTKARSIAC